MPSPHRRAIRLLTACLPLFALTACGAPTGDPLVSTQFPPGTGVVNAHSPAQTPNSLPPGAANIAPGPGGYQPNYFSTQFRAF